MTSPMTPNLPAPPRWPSSPRPSVEEILRAVHITSLTRELDLSYARGLSPSTFKQLLMCLPHLRKLTMRHTDIGRLPDAFKHVPELRELDVSHNDLGELPSSLGELTRLQHLTATGNRLQALPQSMGRLHALRFLNVSSNRIVALGPEIRFCTSLRVLRLASNRLAELNPGVGELPGLQLLQLSFNRLRRLPEELAGASQLRVLNVAFNALSDLPQSFEALRELAHLDITGNDIVSLPTCLNGLESLRVRGLDNPNWRVSGQATQVTASPLHKASAIWSDPGTSRTREIHLNPAQAARTMVTSLKRALNALTSPHAAQKASPDDKTRVLGHHSQGRIDIEADNNVGAAQAPTRVGQNAPRSAPEPFGHKPRAPR